MSKESITMWSRYWLIERKKPLAFLRLVWFNLTHRKSTACFLKYAIASGMTVPIGLGSLYLLTDVVGIHYLTSNAIAFVLSTAIWWSLHSTWTFRDMQTDVLSVPKTLVVRLLVLGINEVILYALTTTGLWYMASSAVAITIGFPVGFYLSRRWIWYVQRSLQV